MKRIFALLLAGASVCFAALCSAQTTNTNFRGLPGVIYETEDWSTPRDAWLTNHASATKWNLWTTEGRGKRSRDASLVSPVVAKDRATPEEGAPVLHTHITGIHRGVYRAWLGPTNRPLAYSLDGGKTWLKTAGGETDLGVYDITNGAFDLWADDRFACPENIGPAYYDYIRLIPFTPPTLSHLSAFTLPDGSTQISWTSNEPASAAVVECDGREFTETEDNQRNHRVILSGLSAGKSYEARVRCLRARVAPLKFIAGRQPRITRSEPQTLELTVTEPTDTPRKNWPVTSGVPFARGVLATAADAALFDTADHRLPAQFEATAFWPDGSVKWLQLSFCADTAREPLKLRLRIGRHTEASAFQGVAVHEDADAVVVKNGPLSLRVGRENFALFDGLPAIGEPKGGNGRILDAAGNVFTLGKPDQVAVEERGPIRAVVRVAGDFVAPNGAKLFRWQARYFVCAGQPWVRLSWTIGNNNTNAVLTNLQTAGIRIPFAADAPLLGSCDGAPAARINDDTSTWLLQDKDDRFTSSLNGAATAGGHSLGCASVTDGRRRLAVFVKDFWQLYPKGIAIKRDGLHVRVLPPLPADAYAKESQSDEELVRLYYCYDRGQYRVKRGLEFTTDIFVRSDAAPASLPAAGLTQTSEQNNAAWFNHPLFAVAPPQHYCDSGVFGIVEPAQPGIFDAYEKQVESGFAKMELNRQRKHEYGWMNYGDWHGERHFNWGNHEYDMMGALALQFIRTGDTKWLWSADSCTRHSTDIDTIHYPWLPRMPGRVYAHSIGHVGGFFDTTDPRFQRLGNVFGLADPKRPNYFVTGAIDPGGHIFQPGNFRTGFLTGERRDLETAAMICEAQAAYMTAKFDFGIERAAGWPLMNAVAAYEATGNPFFLNAARLYVEKITGKQTARGDWNLKHGPPECLHEPPHYGGKAFAAGVLLNGLMMFDATAPSAEVKQCIVRAAHWLEQYAWNHETHGFRYIDTCPTFANGRGNGGTDFLVSSGLAYACTLDHDPALKSLLLDSLSRAMRGGVSVGKDYTQDIRQTPHALAILHKRFGIKELPNPAPVAAK